MPRNMPSLNIFSACQNFCGEQGTNFDVTRDADVSFPEEDLERTEFQREEVVESRVQNAPPMMTPDQINLQLEREPEEVKFHSNEIIAQLEPKQEGRQDCSEEKEDPDDDWPTSGSLLDTLNSYSLKPPKKRVPLLDQLGEQPQTKSAHDLEKSSAGKEEIPDLRTSVTSPPAALASNVAAPPAPPKKKKSFFACCGKNRN